MDNVAERRDYLHHFHGWAVLKTSRGVVGVLGDAEVEAADVRQLHAKLLGDDGFDLGRYRSAMTL